MKKALYVMIAGISILFAYTIGWLSGREDLVCRLYDCDSFVSPKQN